MGQSFILIPVDGDVLPWLDDNGIPRPAMVNPARHPTPTELVEAVSSLSDFRYAVTPRTPGGFWHLEIESTDNPQEGPWAFVTVGDLIDEQTPSQTSFERASPEVMLPMALQLVPVIGPFILQSDGGERPILVHNESTLADLFAQFGEL